MKPQLPILTALLLPPHAGLRATGCRFLGIHPPETALDKTFTGSGFKPKPCDIIDRALVVHQCH